MKAKKIIIAVSLEDETTKTLQQLKNMNIGKDLEIHLVHMIPMILYARGMSFQVLTYPLEEERPRIQEHILAALNDLKNDLFPEHTNVKLKCIFDSNEKAAFTEYVKNQNADLAVIATRPRHGLFDSSFAQHQLKHSPANVLVLR